MSEKEPKMSKERVREMAEAITQLRQFINPLILRFSLEEWEQIHEQLNDRYNTTIGGAPIITAMGGDWELKGLQTRFQSKIGEAMYDYARKLYEALEIQKKIEKHQKSKKEGQVMIEKLFG